MALGADVPEDLARAAVDGRDDGGTEVVLELAAGRGARCVAREEPLGAEDVEGSLWCRWPASVVKSFRIEPSTPGTPPLLAACQSTQCPISRATSSSTAMRPIRSATSGSSRTVDPSGRRVRRAQAARSRASVCSGDAGLETPRS
jgi:hypothetical protein